MVISASRRTDIPAFYAEWFMNRLDAGYCFVRNPMSGKPLRVSLLPEDVDGVVFWTKNPLPIMPSLPEMRERNLPFIFQFTITPYAGQIERSVIPVDTAAGAAHRIADEFGEHAVVWRYDPILVSNWTPLEWHLERFRSMAAQLSGAANEVTTKFLLMHVKTRRNLNKLLGDRWRDPSNDEKRDLLAEMKTFAKAAGMRLTVCTQPEISGDLPSSVCIDAARLNACGANIARPKKQPSRPGCQCVESRDIGEYDTCPNGCAYCYANENAELAVRRRLMHDPAGEALIPWAGPAPPTSPQLRLGV